MPMLFEASKSTTPQIVSFSFLIGAARTYRTLSLTTPFPFAPKFAGNGLTLQPPASRFALSRCPVNIAQLQPAMPSFRLWENLTRLVPRIHTDPKNQCTRARYFLF